MIPNVIAYVTAVETLKDTDKGSCLVCGKDALISLPFSAKESEIERINKIFAYSSAVFNTHNVILPTKLFNFVAVQIGTCSEHANHLTLIREIILESSKNILYFGKIDESTYLLTKFDVLDIINRLNRV